MPRAWRILKKRHEKRAFDGEGARLYGGRWNSPGIPAVYASESRALATLEVLAGLQMNSPLPGYVLIPAEFDEALVEVIELNEVPADWRQHPPAPSTQRLGDDWISRGESAVLQVPSALVPKESNFVLNPRHPDFSAIHVGEPELLSLDPRLLR